MKAYVWMEVLVDHTNGMVLVLAESDSEAAKILMEQDDLDAFSRITGEDGLTFDCRRPIVYESGPAIHFVWGGG